MSEAKTRATAASVEEFLAGVEPQQRRTDCEAVVALMRDVTGEEPRMWGPSIVGFGERRYRYDSGREGDWFLVGFSPRKSALTLYLTTGFEPDPRLMERLGTHSTGKACLYVERLADVDSAALRELVDASVRFARAGSG